MKNKKMIYQALVPLFSRQHNKTFQPGEIIELSPNPESPKEGDIVVDFELLEELGFMAPVSEDKAGQGE